MNGISQKSYNTFEPAIIELDWYTVFSLWGAQNAMGAGGGVYPRMQQGGQYASYWNASLFTV